MASFQEFLSPDDYTNFRNVRAAALLLLILGGVLALGGLLAPFAKHDPRHDTPLAAAITIGIVGAAGAIGGFAALLGSRRWSKLAYVFAWPYLLAFPFGTILAYTILKGLDRFLDTKDRIRQARAAGV